MLIDGGGIRVDYMLLLEVEMERKRTGKCSVTDGAKLGEHRLVIGHVASASNKRGMVGDVIRTELSRTSPQHQLGGHFELTL